MKKILLISLMVLTLGLGFVSVNAEEITTEEPITEEPRTIYVEEEVIVVSEDGEYNFTNNWELAREEVQEIYYENWDKVDLDTLTIYFDDKLVLEDGVASDWLIEPFYKRFDTEQYENYPKLFDFSFMEDVDGDGEIENIYQIVVNKDGTGTFYKANINIEKHVSTELRITFEVLVIDDGSTSLNSEDIKSWIDDALKSDTSNAVVTAILENNLIEIIMSASFVGVGGYLFYKFRKKFLPKTIQATTGMFSVLVGNLFGVKYGGDKDIAEALPFVENMDNLSNYMNVQVEMKLLDLKQKINSPSFTDKEKISLQKTYNYLYKEYGKNISSEVKDILRNYNSEEL